MILVFFLFLLDMYFNVHYIFENVSVVFIIVGDLYNTSHAQTHQKLKHDKDQSKHIKQ